MSLTYFYYLFGNSNIIKKCLKSDKNIKTYLENSSLTECRTQFLSGNVFAPFKVTKNFRKDFFSVWEGKCES